MTLDEVDEAIVKASGWEGIPHTIVIFGSPFSLLELLGCNVVTRGTLTGFPYGGTL